MEAKIPSLKDLAVREFKPEALLNIVLWDLKRQPELSRCTPESILYCIKFAVQHGLEIGGTVGHLHMVPFGNVATPIIGYKGVVAVLTDPKRGNLRSIQARPIYEKDGFKCNYTTNGIDFEHIPRYAEDRGEMIGVWSAFRDQDDKLLHVEVMTRAEVDKVRKSSKAANAGPWVTWYEEKAKVTVVKRGAKYIPIGHGAAQVLADADEIEFGRGPAIDVTDESEVESAPTKTEEIKERLKTKAIPKPDPKREEFEDADRQLAKNPMPEREPWPEREPEPEPQAEPQAEPQPTGKPGVPNGPGRPSAQHIANMREKVEEHLAVMNEEAEYTIQRWAAGTGKPRSWNWRIHSTKGDLETILALLQEEVTLTQ